MAKDKSGPRTRRTKAEMNPEILGKMVAALSVGASNKDAAHAAGISADAFEDYVRRGEAGQEPFAAWLIEVRAARAKKKTYIVGLLHEAAESDWKAGAWLLERQFPKEYSKRVEVAAEVGVKAVGPDLSRLSTEELRELSAIQEKLKGD